MSPRLVLGSCLNILTLTMLLLDHCGIVHASSALTPRQRAVRQGIDCMLDERYALSHAIFDSLISVEPERPEGYLGKALSYWNESMLLADGERFVDSVDRLTGRAIKLSERALKMDNSDAEMVFLLGKAYGLRAGLALIHGSPIDGVLHGLKCRDFLEETIRLKPDLADAHFGLGLAEYVAARQPRFLRMVSRLLSLPDGDRKRGLERLERVAREGIYTQRHAVSSRAYIALYYEKDYEDARRRFTDLHLRYPHSLDYRIRYLDALFGLTIQGRKDHREALIDSARSIRFLAEERNWNLNRWSRTKLDFIEGFGLYLNGNADAAVERLEIYAAEATKKSWLLGPTNLILGKLADLRNDRERAVGHYRRVRKYENVWGVHEEADAYIGQPFSGEEPVRRPPDTVRRYPEKP